MTALGRDLPVAHYLPAVGAKPNASPFQALACHAPIEQES